MCMLHLTKAYTWGEMPKEILKARVLSIKQNTIKSVKSLFLSQRLIFSKQIFAYVV